jgi:hypothetical protein
MPAIYPVRPFVDLGGLMSYGDVLDINRQVGIYVGKSSRVPNRLTCPSNKPPS